MKPLNKTMKSRRGMLVAYLAALVLLAGAAHAQGAPDVDPVPTTVNYQGKLYQADGKTPETGTRDLVVRLYAAKDDAPPAAIWAERHNAAELFEGVFNVVLGEGATVGSFNHDPLDEVFTVDTVWIGVSIPGEGEREERQRLVSAPYAFTANTAVYARHGVPAGTIAAWGGTITVTSTPDGDVVEGVPEGWLPCLGDLLRSETDSEAPEEPAYPELSAAIGTAWNRSGDPDGMFRVPNFGGRVLAGANTPEDPIDPQTGQSENNDHVSPDPPTDAGLTKHALGDLLGEETHKLTVDEIPMHWHDHNDYLYKWVDYAPGPDGVNPTRTVLAATSHEDPDYVWTERTTFEHGQWRSVPHENMQQSIVVPFIIKH